MSDLRKLPPAFVERLRRLVPPGLWTETARGLSEPKPTTFRVNMLRAPSEAAVRRDLEKAGVSVDPVAGFAEAFTVRKGSFKKLSESRSYREGWIYLQSLSSQIPPLVLRPRPGEEILDMAAAPGGKTCQMAAMMGNVGKIVAVEPDRIRRERLSFNLNRQGVTIAETLGARAEKLGEDFHGRFDRVLLDAPCSSEGTFYAAEPQRSAHWSVAFVQKMSVLQKKLLSAAFACLKPGGTLAYSTCALSPEENEAAVSWAVGELGFEALDVPLKFPFLRPALASWQGIKFHPDSAKARRVYPAATMEGFFVALLRKA